MNVNYCYVVPGSGRPLEEDVRLLAYKVWVDSGKKENTSLQNYYEASNLLTTLINDHPRLFTHFLYKLRAWGNRSI